VKGKAQAVNVFTPCSDASLVTLTEQAWQAYLGRDWAKARAALQELRGIAPEDRMALMMEERIGDCERQEPAPDWDGSVGLDKL
jgi:hypothetical protein